MRTPYVFSVFQAKDLGLRAKLYELRYWYIQRQTRKFIPWLAGKLPEKLKYWVVIHGMVRVEPNFSPEHVTGMQLLDLWREKAES